MKKSTIVWSVVVGLVLVGLGFAAGFLFNRGGMGLVGAVGRGRIMPFGAFRVLAGLGLMARLVFCLGPLAGIVALIVVLTRRNPSTNPAPAQTTPATSGATSAVQSDPTATATAESTPPMPIKRKR